MHGSSLHYGDLLYIHYSDILYVCVCLEGERLMGIKTDAKMHHAMSMLDAHFRV